jgi:tripartite-type tricarboxylate transporter receptor subunit TctC
MTTTKMTTRHRLSLSAAAFTALVTLSALSAVPAQAQAYPQKPITLIVPFAPGGGTDSIARDVGKALGEKLGQVVIIENKGGAGGSIGANAVAKAPADGYTLLFATSTFVTNAAAEATPSYNIEKDFSPIAMIGRGPLLVVASKVSRSCVPRWRLGPTAPIFVPPATAASTICRVSYFGKKRS